jgi:hypothetical protein
MQVMRPSFVEADIARLLALAAVAVADLHRRVGGAQGRGLRSP